MKIFLYFNRWNPFQIFIKRILQEIEKMIKAETQTLIGQFNQTEANTLELVTQVGMHVSTDMANLKAQIDTLTQKLDESGSLTDDVKALTDTMTTHINNSASLASALNGIDPTPAAQPAP